MSALHAGKQAATPGLISQAGVAGPYIADSAVHLDLFPYTLAVC